MLPAGSVLQSIEEVDQPGIRIAVSERSAYDLFLTRNLKHAELVRAKGLPGAMKLFLNEKLDALAGLRPLMIQGLPDIPGARILDGRFTAVQQAVGMAKANDAAAALLSDFVEVSKEGGLVARLIEKHGVIGKLSVAQAG